MSLHLPQLSSLIYICVTLITLIQRKYRQQWFPGPKIETETMKIIEEEGCRAIISYLTDEEIFALLDTVTKKQIKATTKEEAIDAIISYEDSAEQFLQRQKIKRELLVKYLNTESVYVNPSANKKTLVGTVIKTWGTKDRILLDDDDDDFDEEDEIPLKQLVNRKKELENAKKNECSTSRKSSQQTSQPIDILQAATVQAGITAPSTPPLPPPDIQTDSQNISSVSALPPQINIHLHINQLQNIPGIPHMATGDPGIHTGTSRSPSEIQTFDPNVQALGEKFAKWFYDNLNSFNPTVSLGISKDFGPQHFWDDVHLEIELFSPNLHNEALNGAFLVSNRLLAFPKEDHVLFNPNISREGVFVKSSPHGLVKILACGSVHRANACLGIFQQAFGIIRDPRFENNWKIKYLKLQMRTGEVTSLPKLEGDLESQVQALVPL